jgi:sugar/nucleoside kinase (ribokinase family)
MRRYFRVVPDIESWLENIDILQMNENEMRSLGMGEEEFSIAERVFNYRPSVIIITKGVKGSRIFMKTEHDFFSYYEPAVEVNSVNNVGCGDVFGAAFFYDYIKTGNVLESFRTANRYGAVSTTYKNINDLINIKNDIDKFADQ